jgi:hypothetical protein
VTRRIAGNTFHTPAETSTAISPVLFYALRGTTRSAESFGSLISAEMWQDSGSPGLVRPIFGVEGSVRRRWVRFWQPNLNGRRGGAERLTKKPCVSAVQDIRV